MRICTTLRIVINHASTCLYPQGCGIAVVLEVVLTRTEPLCYSNQKTGNSAGILAGRGKSMALGPGKRASFFPDAGARSNEAGEK